MPKAYHIRTWNEEYETAETRKYANLNWFPKKTKLFGEGISYTLGKDDGFALYGIWTILEALAAGSTKSQRGWLIRNEKPLDAQRIANLLRKESAPIQAALDFFCSPDVAWLEFIETPPQMALGLTGESPTTPPPIAGKQDAAGRLPGESPTTPPPIAGKQDAAGRKSLDRQTDRQNKDGKNYIETGHAPEVNCPPALAEVIAHGLTLTPPLLAEPCEEFFRYWTGRGWMMTDKCPMSDFRPVLQEHGIRFLKKNVAAKTSPQKAGRERWQVDNELKGLREKIAAHPVLNWPSNKPVPATVQAGFDALVARRKALEKEAV